VAILTGWLTAEVGRQPWVIYGVMRTADAVTPSLSSSAALTSLTAYLLVYTLIFSAGTLYLNRLLREGPDDEGPEPAQSDSAGEHPIDGSFTPGRRPLAAGSHDPGAGTKGPSPQHARDDLSPGTYGGAA
jgi:cytochrome d ubiquinol oxidase subunit I